MPSLYINHQHGYMNDSMFIIGADTQFLFDGDPCLLNGRKFKDTDHVKGSIVC